MQTIYPFQPDYVVPPGATLREVLEERGVSQAVLAARTELTEKTISQIINGVAPITYETAARLELAIGIPARFWNSRESHYREFLVRIEEASRLESEAEWLQTIPVNVLIERGCIRAQADKSGLIREVLKFFQASSVAAWNAIWNDPEQMQFRGTKAPAWRPGSVAAWHRMGEIAAEKLACQPFNERAFRSALSKIRSVAAQPPQQEDLQRLCADAGAAVVFIQELPRAGVSGITKWISKDKALIVLGLNQKSDDQFWLTFFHEACHILKHGKRLVFYEGLQDPESPLEHEANRFARDIMIPPQHAAKLAFLKSKLQVQQFAATMGVAPGIIVGRMQHDKLLPPGRYNDLKRNFELAK